ncbi:MAG TPA: basic amino acid ABC transporter substrate-binding protein [Solirubrobacterales bacterium]|nr:basic amino acid ABC transporter substrate-binding protein [Solirubrobacterales bacterium]
MTKTRLWAILAALALAIGTLGLAACGDDDDGGGGGGTTTKQGGAAANLGTIEEGKLSVGTDTPFPPFEIGQPPDISGYDIEVMDAIAKQIGVDVEYTDTGFDTIFRDVQQGQFDTAAAASTITPERQQQVNFTDPYYEAQQALLVPTDGDIKSVDDLDGKIVGTQDGTTGETYANDETDASEVRGFPEGPDATQALVTGQVDAVIIDLPVAVDAVEQQEGFEIVEEIATNELYGFAVAKDKTELLDAMNKALATLKKDGTINELYQKYFKTKPPKSVLEGKTKSA